MECSGKAALGSLGTAGCGTVRCALAVVFSFGMFRSGVVRFDKAVMARYVALGHIGAWQSRQAEFSNGLLQNDPIIKKG